MPTHSKSSDKATKPGQTKRGPPPNEVRIMGGLWKRTPLPVPDQPGLRPTPGRVRETLFNWLGQDMTGLRCIDAFAGSGALGLEAASRGAKEVWLVEQDGSLVTNLRRLLQKLSAHHVRLDKADALNVLARCAGQGWDGVFLDPPFLDGQNDDLTRRALSAAKAAIAPTGWVYLESPREWLAADLLALGLVPHKQGQAGQVHYALLHVAQLA
jgi:16S rRNA (guanine966-N2)-methyltransferase